MVCYSQRREGILDLSLSVLYHVRIRDHHCISAHGISSCPLYRSRKVKGAMTERNPVVFRERMVSLRERGHSVTLVILIRSYNNNIVRFQCDLIRKTVYEECWNQRCNSNERSMDYQINSVIREKIKWIAH